MKTNNLLGMGESSASPNRTMPPISVIHTPPVQSMQKRDGPLHCGIQSPKIYIPPTDLDDDDNEQHSRQFETEKQSKRWLSKAIALCKYLWPAMKKDGLSVSYLARGSFNIVFAVTMVTMDGETNNYVLRIPEDSTAIRQTTAILMWLSEYTHLKTPRVITWDATEQNPLEHGYVILTRLPGVCLQDVWVDLSHCQKLIFAKQMARLLLEIESVTNPVAGVIRVHSTNLTHGGRSSHQSNDQMFVEAFGAEVWETANNPVNWLNSENGILPLDRVRQDVPGLAINDIMTAIFKRRMYHAKNHVNGNQEFLLDYFNPCQKIIEDMVHAGVFQDDVISLRHPDLFSRNIMVDFTPDIVVTGTLDWDDALFVPRFAGRILPRWLWTPQMHWNPQMQLTPQTLPNGHPGSPYVNLNDDPLDPNDNEADSLEHAELKRAFEEAAGEEWTSEATGRWFPLARYLLWFSQETFYHNGITEDDIATWKKRCRDLLTDAVENFSLWRDLWKTHFIQESDEHSTETTNNDADQQLEKGGPQEPLTDESLTAIIAWATSRPMSKTARSPIVENERPSSPKRAARCRQQDILVITKFEGTDGIVTEDLDKELEPEAAGIIKQAEAPNDLQSNFSLLRNSPCDLQVIISLRPLCNDNLGTQEKHSESYIWLFSSQDAIAQGGSGNGGQALQVVVRVDMDALALPGVADTGGHETGAEPYAAPRVWSADNWALHTHGAELLDY
ncbi:hypothetical protein GGR54DRAFT_639847 [Hypoxylon sp. NC1633]|nr:hypothetical protein GGR54DRAFT_639847 [Hypoxylon sp. NC1633]